MTEPITEEAAQAWRLHHMESSIEALNVRIARLAIGLGISLKNEVEVAQVMVRQQTDDTHQPHESAHLSSTADVRMARQIEELRGLLVLRYGMETSYVDEVGVTVTRQILREAEEHLARDGFEPGADGIDLNRLFNQS